MRLTYKQIVPPPKSVVDPKFQRSRCVRVLIASICGKEVPKSEKMTLLELLWKEVDNEARVDVGKAMTALNVMA